MYVNRRNIFGITSTILLTIQGFTLFCVRFAHVNKENINYIKTRLTHSFINLINGLITQTDNADHLQRCSSINCSLNLYRLILPTQNRTNIPIDWLRIETTDQRNEYHLAEDWLEEVLTEEKKLRLPNESTKMMFYLPDRVY